MRTVIVKLRNDVPPGRGLARLRSAVGEEHLEAAGPLFPGDTEPETASLLELRLRDSAPLAKLLKTIQAVAGVEYAHEPAPRHPR